MKTREEISKLFKGTFGTELGKRCLAHLEETFVERAIYIKGMSVEDAAYRQGEADVIKKIMKEFKDER